MGVQYKHARPGYRWVLTMWGLEQPRVRAKFENSYINKASYEQAVPTTWVRLDYVREEKIK